MSHSLPLVSVVIPAHNAAPWLARALDSVLAQTHPPAEIFVIDDHSNDGTAALAARYVPRVRVLDATVKGSNPARNQGLRETTAPWIQFLDADDFLRPEKIARQLAIAVRDGADFVYSPSLMIVGENENTAPLPTAPATGDPVEAFLAARGFQTGAVLWQRSELLAIGGWNESFRRCQDYELASRALRLGLKAAWSPHADAAYCLHEAPSLSRARPFATMQGMVALIEEFCEWLKSQGRFHEGYAEVARRRLLDLLWSANDWDAAWAETAYAQLASNGLVRPRLFASGRDTSLALIGWRTSARLRRALGARRTS